MDLFLICFVTGLGILLFNLIFGSISDFFSIDLDLDLGTDGHMAHGILGFLSPSNLSGFLIAFGGMGYFFKGIHLAFWMVWTGAIISGLVSAYLLVQLMRFLKRHENGRATISEDIIGLPALVVSPVLKEGYGSIRYSVNGNTFSSPAVSYDGSPIASGVEVAIVSIKGHLYVVSPLELEE